MKRFVTTIALFAILAPTPASAELLTREDFADVTPVTFDDFAGMMDMSNFDFGPFTVLSPNVFDTFAYYMPRAAPVVLPTVGGDTFTILLEEPTAAIGLDIGIVDWFAPTIEFYGDDNGTEVLLDSFVLTDLLGPGPSGLQDFVGYRGSLPVHKIVFGQGDCYFDNVYLGMSSVPVQDATWTDLKESYK